MRRRKGSTYLNIDGSEDRTELFGEICCEFSRYILACQTETCTNQGLAFHHLHHVLYLLKMCGIKLEKLKCCRVHRGRCPSNIESYTKCLHFHLKLQVISDKICVVLFGRKSVNQNILQRIGMYIVYCILIKYSIPNSKTKNIFIQYHNGAEEGAPITKNYSWI